MHALPATPTDEWSDSEVDSGCYDLAQLRGKSEDDLRALAMQADAALNQPQELGPLWHRLIAGNAVIVDWFHSSTRWFVLCSHTASEGSKPVPERVSRLFESLFLGKSQKTAAFEHGVCTATISVTVHKALEQLGIACTPRRVPPILALLVRAGLGLATPGARYCKLVARERLYEVVSIERPELRLEHKLSPAEYHVLCRIVAGDTYAAIAAERRTSRRTVANQVCSVFRRLEVSGRAELVARVVELAAVPAACGAGVHD